MFFFDDEVKLANHINNIWDNHFDWWSSDKLQKEVNEFRSNFAYVNKNKLKDLKEIITYR